MCGTFDAGVVACRATSLAPHLPGPAQLRLRMTPGQGRQLVRLSRVLRWKVVGIMARRTELLAQLDSVPVTGVMAPPGPGAGVEPSVLAVVAALEETLREERTLYCNVAVVMFNCILSLRQASRCHALLLRRHDRGEGEEQGSKLPALGKRSRPRQLPCSADPLISRSRDAHLQPMRFPRSLLGPWFFAPSMACPTLPGTAVPGGRGRGGIALPGRSRLSVWGWGPHRGGRVGEGKEVEAAEEVGWDGARLSGKEGPVPTGKTRDCPPQRAPPVSLPGLEPPVSLLGAASGQSGIEPSPGPCHTQPAERLGGGVGAVGHHGPRSRRRGRARLVGARGGAPRADRAFSGAGAAARDCSMTASRRRRPDFSALAPLRTLAPSRASRRRPAQRQPCPLSSPN